MKIACWSGPRNISTALMRSWSSRDDTFVSDEPFYAHYLKVTGLNHPMKEEIINNYPTNRDDIIQFLTSNIPNKKEIWYQKHMAQHLLDINDLSWIKNFKNCILIRHPKFVINSYIKKYIEKRFRFRLSSATFNNRIFKKKNIDFILLKLIIF